MIHRVAQSRTGLKRVSTRALFRFTQFYLIPFLCSRIPPSISRYIQLSCLLSFLVTVTVSQAFPLLNGLDNFEQYWPDILQNAPLLGLCLIFLVIALGVWVFFQEENYRGEVPFSSHLYQGYIISTLFLTVDINLDLLDEVVFVRFLPYKITLFPLLHAILFESESLCAACIQGM